MAITIHHGANGSYKTSGVIMDFLIPAIEKGRVVVTNIRGVSLENTLDVYPDDVHPDFDVIFIDTDRSEGREKIARFWHWAPLGALMLFDEAGVMFPKRWRDSDLKKLDYPQGENEGRPINWTEAWEMHRHYNWDIVLSAPNISLLRTDIRATTEGACKHRNNKMIGFGGSYNEGFHSAQNNGTSPKDLYSLRRRKIKPIVFKLYQSTKTGEHSDSSAGTSLLHNGRLMFTLVVALSALGYSAYSFISDGPIIKSTTQQASLSRTPVPKMDSEPRLVKAVRVDNNNVVSVKINPAFKLGAFSGYHFTYGGFMGSGNNKLHLFKLTKDNEILFINSKEMALNGYGVVPVSHCVVTIIYKSYRQNAICNKITTKRPRGA